MAEEKVGIEIEVKGSEKSINSVKELKKAIKEAKDEQLRMSEAFGATSKEAVKAAQNVAELTDKMDDLGDATKSVKGSGVESVGASFGLLGDGLKNLDLDKVKAGFSGLGKAMSAVPLILLVEGVQYLVEKFEIFKIIGAAVEKVLFGITDALGITNKAAEAQTKSMIENMDAQNKAVQNRYDNEIKLAKAAGQETNELEISKLRSVESSVSKQLEVLENKANTQKGLNEEEIKQYTELQQKLLDVNTDRIAKEIEADRKRLEALNKNAVDLFSFTDSVNRERERAGMSAREREIADIKDKVKQQLAELDKVKKGITDEQTYIAAKEARKKIEETAQIEINAINSKYAKEAAKEKDRLNKERLDKALADEKSYNEALDALSQVQKEKKLIAMEEETIAFQQKVFTQSEIDNINRRKFEQDEQATAQYSLQVAQATTQSLQGLSDLYFMAKSKNLQKGSQAEMEAAKKQFQINKALAITSAVISGIQGVINALSAQSVIPEPYGTILKVANAVAVGVASAVNIAKIASTQFNPGSAPSSGGGVSATPAPIPAPPTINTPSANPGGTTFSETGQAIGNESFKKSQTPTVNVKAQVVETEMTNKQQQVKQIENQATF